MKSELATAAFRLATGREVVFVSLFLLTLVSGLWVNMLDEQLVTVEAPKGIISLEVASTTDAIAIKKSWEDQEIGKETPAKFRQQVGQASHELKDKKHTKVSVALRSIYRDYAFIACYSLLLAALVFIKSGSQRAIFHFWPARRWKRIFLVVVACIAFFDVVENIGMTLFLTGSISSSAWFAIPAQLKLSLLLLTGFHLITFRLLSKLLKVLSLYLIGIVTVSLIFWLLINLTQGQDIIMLAGEEFWPGVIALAGAWLWSFYTWYSARLVGYARLMQSGGLIPPSYHEHIPRILAFNALVSIQAAILALPTIYALTETELWIFVLFQNALYFLFYRIVINNPYKKAYVVILCACSLIYASMCLYKWKPASDILHLRVLPVAVILLYAIQFLTTYRYIVRRGKWHSAVTPTLPDTGTGALVSIFNWVIIEVPQEVLQNEKPFFRKFNGAAFIGFIFYLSGYVLYMANLMGPLTTTLLSFAIFVGVSNFISVVSLRLRTNLFIYLIGLAVIVGRLYDPYGVRMVETQDKPYSKRPTLAVYFNRWLAQRDSLLRKSVEADHDFPVYVVIADGGASRSGYWVSSVLSSLEDESMKQQHSRFSQHLFALAGASGGSVGNATFYALLKNRPLANETFLDRSRYFLRNDFLAPVIISWLGSDFVQHIIPLGWAGVRDRATVLETAMERFDSTKTFATPFSHVADTTGELPILFLNVTNVQQGIPSVISTIQLEPFSTRIDLLDSVTHASTDTLSEIRYSTAVVLGARFPYVSPGGSIGNESYVDGGYFDNTGAGIIHEMMQELDSYIKCQLISFGEMTSSDSLKCLATQSEPPLDSLHTRERIAKLKKLKFKVIYLSNTPMEVKEETPLHPLLNDAATPIMTVLGTYGTQTSVNNKRLENFMRRNVGVDTSTFKVFNLYRKNDTTTYPMNWVISDYGLNNMNIRFNEVTKDSAFAEILREIK
jgi:hypothetical protein